MKFISLGTIDIKFLIPVVGSIISLIYRISIQYSPKLLIINQNPFLKSLYIALGMIFGFIPYIIIKHRSKAGNKIYNEQIIKSELYKKLTDNKDVIKKTKYKKYRFIFYTAFLDFSYIMIITFFTQYFAYNLWIFDIIFMSLFSFLILKTKYYKHQFISMIIIVILGFGFNIIAYFKSINAEVGLTFINILMKFIAEICFCLSIVIMKYNLEKNYCNPYELCFWEGIFEFILYSICLAIFCIFGLSANKFKHPDNLIKFFNQYDYNDFIVCLAIIITYFLYNNSIILTCDYLTPIHLLIISVINEVYIHFLQKSNLALNIFSFFILLLIFIMLLVFIEVIEINICKLSYNTKRNIESRSKTDTSVELEAINLLNDEPELDEGRDSDIIASNYIINY